VGRELRLDVLKVVSAVTMTVGSESGTAETMKDGGGFEACEGGGVGGSWVDAGGVGAGGGELMAGGVAAGGAAAGSAAGGAAAGGSGGDGPACVPWSSSDGASSVAIPPSSVSDFPGPLTFRLT
jgi:hypothetical protein